MNTTISQYMAQPYRMADINPFIDIREAHSEESYAEAREGDCAEELACDMHEALVDAKVDT